MRDSAFCIGDVGEEPAKLTSGYCLFISNKVKVVPVGPLVVFLFIYLLRVFVCFVAKWCALEETLEEVKEICAGK